MHDAFGLYHVFGPGVMRLFGDDYSCSANRAGAKPPRFVCGRFRMYPFLHTSMRVADELGISDILAMPGFADNPFAYMRQARLFVLSSRWEGFGLVIVEALACGCPVLSTACPNGPSEILEGGKYGRLTPVGDAAEMARAIEESLDAPADSEVLATRARDFELDRIARMYLETLGLDPAP